MPAPAAEDSALQELRLRYARGDLDRNEYVQRFRDLGGEGPEPAPPSPPAPPDAEPPSPLGPEAEEAMTEVREAMRWLVDLGNFFWLTENESLGYESTVRQWRQVLQGFREQLDEREGAPVDGTSYEWKVQAYHLALDRAFGRALVRAGHARAAASPDLHDCRRHARLLTGRSALAGRATGLIHRSAQMALAGGSRLCRLV
jgi:hypothetical protein